MSLLKGLLKESEDILCKQGELVSSFLGADLELDGSRRREISLYRNNEVVLAVEHGVTLGLLKLIYSSDSKFHGVLQGVRSRSASDPSAVSTVILSDDRVLDRDEYDLIIQDSNNVDENLLPLTTSLPGSIFVANANNTDKKKGQFVCEYCHLPFVSKAKFHRHRRIHTEENPYVCVYCNEAFPHHLDLRKHREEHHMLDKPFKCSYCPKTFSTRAELRGHLWRHTGEKNHKCRICSKTFATKGNLKLHIDKHIGVHKHKCPFCPQRFTSHSSLEAHMAKHTGLKAYKCRYCTKSYAQAGQLTSHERLHTGEKPFVCAVCGKGFRLNSTRLAHEKRHSGARPHICDTCGRSFAMPDHLRRHMKTHENKLDRVVACPFCKKKIFQGRNMRKHLFRHRELNLTEMQAKMISSSLKPDWQENEKNQMEEDQRAQGLGRKRTLHCQRCNEELKSIRKLFKHLSEVHYQRELTSAERKEIRLQYGVQKLHHCQFCLAYFMDFRLLRSHVLSEHPENSADLGFTTKSGGRNNAPHKCPNCSKVFELRSVLDKHIIKEHLTTVVTSTSQSNEQLLQFRCWYCQDNFQTPEEVVAHMTNQHESLDVLSKRVEEAVSDNDVSSTGLWACPHCTVNLKTESEYNTHVAQHTQPNDCSSKIEESCTAILPDSCTIGNLWVCPHCPVSLKNESEYNAHIALHSHTNVLSSKGEGCSVVAQTIEESCTMANLWVCPHCHINLDNEREYNVHVELHSQTSSSACVAQPIEDSCAMNNASSSSEDDISSYLNSIGGDDSENWVDECVVQKYLTTDPHVSTKANTTGVSSDVNIDESNSKNGLNTSSIIGSSTSINDNSSAITTPSISTTSDTTFVNSSTDITFETYVQNVSNDVSDVSSTTLSNTHSSYVSGNISGSESVLSNSNISSVPTLSEVNSNQSTTSLLNTPTDKLKYNKKPLPILPSPPRIILMNNIPTGRDGKNSSVKSIDFDVVNSEASIVQKNSEELNVGDEGNPKMPLINTEISSEICTINTTNDDFASEKCRKIRKKRKEMEKKAVKDHTKMEPPRLKFGSSSTNNTRLLMESCRFCSDVFKNKTELNSHIKAAHPNENGGSIPFRCWFCAETFTTPEDVVVHMTNRHENLDNLSRCIEMAELKNQMAAENQSSPLKLLNLDDTSLSPVDNSLMCPKCQQKLESKEAYELHMMVHDASQRTDLLSTGTDLIISNHTENDSNSLISAMEDVVVAGRVDTDTHTENNFSNENFELPKSVVSSANAEGTFAKMNENVSNSLISAMEDVTVAGRVDTDTHTENNFSNGNFELSKSVVSSANAEGTFTKMNENTDTVSTLSEASEVSSILSATMNTNENLLVDRAMADIDNPLISTLSTDKTVLSGPSIEDGLPVVQETSNELVKIDEQKKSKKTDVAGKLSVQPPKKKSSSSSKKLANTKSASSILDHEYNRTMNLNMCTHCSRVFCTKRALDVHTYKMHGKEYLQKNQVKSTTPFNCWFCSSHFTSPEQVVEHMTSTHENLDSLSKRVEEQGIPESRTNNILPVKLGKPILSPTNANKYVAIAPQKQIMSIIGEQKQMLPIAAPQKQIISIAPQKQVIHTGQLSSYPQTTTDNDRQPPPGFKMSYALAYVPVYVPEQNEKVAAVEKKQ